MKKTMTIKIYYEILKAIIFGLIIVALVVGGLKGYAWVDMRLSHQEAQNKIELENARKYNQKYPDYRKSLILKTMLYKKH